MSATPSAAAERNSSASLRRGLQILLHLGSESMSADGATLTEISRELDLNKSTALRLLAPLCEMGLATKDPGTGRYQLGPRVAQLGQLYLEQLDLRRVARGVLEKLAGQTGETAHLVVPDMPFVIYIDKVDSPQSVRMHSRVGLRSPAYCSAAGKAMLAASPEDVVQATIAHGMTRRTENTFTTAAELLRDLTATRLRGYAIDNIEQEVDVRGLAAAVVDRTGTPICAIGVAGPASRVMPERVLALGDLVHSAAVEVGRRMGYQ